jgi:hypothetical protein
MSATGPAEELTEEVAVALVAGSVRRPFNFFPERQAWELATAVLRDLRRQGVSLIRDTGRSGTGP